MNESGHWIERGNKQYYLKGAYITPVGWKAALDWEQTSDVSISSSVGGQIGVIPCSACGLVFRIYEIWHQAWVLLEVQILWEKVVLYIQ